MNVTAQLLVKCASSSVFPNAIFFGFTGTPIFEENQKKMSQTSTIFGGELHRYVLADGIRDKNVLGFDPRMVQTFKENDVRKQVALAGGKSKQRGGGFCR